jgi:hypothetical protein
MFFKCLCYTTVHWLVKSISPTQFWAPHIKHMYANIYNLVYHTTILVQIIDNLMCALRNISRTQKLLHNSLNIHMRPAPLLDVSSCLESHYVSIILWSRAHHASFIHALRWSQLLRSSYSIWISSEWSWKSFNLNHPQIGSMGFKPVSQETFFKRIHLRIRGMTSSNNLLSISFHVDRFRTSSKPDRNPQTICEISSTWTSAFTKSRRYLSEINF